MMREENEGRNGQPTPEEIQLWLEWAGEILLSLRVNGVYPQQFRSFWPDYPDDILTAYGYTPERTTRVVPSAQDVSLSDKVLGLIPLVLNTRTRRIIHMRSLISPIRSSHIYSWSRIAQILHSNRAEVKTQYDRGLAIVSSKISLSDVSYIRERFPCQSL